MADNKKEDKRKKDREEAELLYEHGALGRPDISDVRPEEYGTSIHHRGSQMNREAVAQELVRVAKLLTGTKHVLRGPNGIKLELDSTEIYPKDPGQGTPAMVYIGEDSATYWTACDMGELNDGTALSQAQSNWLNDQQDKVDQFIEENSPKTASKKLADDEGEVGHPVKLGDIFYSSWGYDQTNIDWYQVTAVGGKSVKIREIRGKRVGGSTGTDDMVPVPNNWSGSEMIKMVKQTPYGISLRITSYASARPWDGKPKGQTAFGYGH